MTRGAVRALLLCALLGACKKPPLEDPAEVAYHHAIELFAKASAETHDLTYRDPRFDEVLTALGQVPVGDELRTKADALVVQIQQARALADSADAESKGTVDKMLEPPPFSPQERDAPFPVMDKSGKKPTSAASPPPSESSADDSSGSSYPGAVFPPMLSKESNNTQLPDWYRQAGYLGLGKKPGAADAPSGAAQANAAPAPDQTANSPAGPSAPSNTAPSTATPPEQQGPPPVFGLPGPAGRAILGGR